MEPLTSPTNYIHYVCIVPSTLGIHLLRATACPKDQRNYKYPLVTSFINIIYTAGQGVISVYQAVVFFLISESPLVFTLTCITTGGPATTVEWRRERLILSNGGINTITNTLMDAQQSTYKHQLTVSGRHLGVYSVSVSNSRTPSPVLSQYTVTGTYAVRIT